MVVGGGISGIQASLDLATAGFKVFLVETSPSIGGHMAQLDKTFPTKRLLHVNSRTPNWSRSAGIQTLRS